MNHVIMANHMTSLIKSSTDPRSRIHDLPHSRRALHHRCGHQYLEEVSCWDVWQYIQSRHLRIFKTFGLGYHFKTFGFNWVTVLKPLVSIGLPF